MTLARDFAIFFLLDACARIWPLTSTIKPLYPFSMVLATTRSQPVLKSSCVKRRTRERVRSGSNLNPTKNVRGDHFLINAMIFGVGVNLRTRGLRELIFPFSGVLSLKSETAAA